MICRKYNCLFVHIPKVAGQSIEHFFLDLMGLTWEERAPLLLRYNGDSKYGPTRLAHLTAAEYVSCGHLNEEEFQKLYKFSFVRNPWARLVSEYRYHGYLYKYSFKEFIAHGFPKTEFSDKYKHIVPQYEFLYDSSGKLLVDFVGRFENLQNDFNLICERLKLEKSVLPHVNSSKTPFNLKRRIKMLFVRKREPDHAHYTQYYDEKTKAIVSEMYRKDIEIFSYSFGD